MRFLKANLCSVLFCPPPQAAPSAYWAGLCKVQLCTFNPRHPIWGAPGERPPPPLPLPLLFHPLSSAVTAPGPGPAFLYVVWFSCESTRLQPYELPATSPSCQLPCGPPSRRARYSMRWCPPDHWHLDSSPRSVFSHGLPLLPSPLPPWESLSSSQ